MDIAIEVSYDGEWNLNEKNVWLHDNGKMKGTVVRNDCTFVDLKNEVYKLLHLDPRIYDLDMKYFFAYPRPGRSPMNCETDHDVYVFLKTLKETPIRLRSPLFVDIVRRESCLESQFEAQVKKDMRPEGDKYSSASDSNKLLHSSPARGEDVIHASMGPILASAVNLPEIEVPQSENNEDLQAEVNEIGGTHAYDVGQWTNDEHNGNLGDCEEENVEHVRKDDDIRLHSPVQPESMFTNIMHGHTPSQTPEEMSQGDAETVLPVEIEPDSGNLRKRSPIRSHVFQWSSEGRTIMKDMLFKSKQELKSKVSMHAIKHNYEFRVKKSDTSRFLAACVDPSCTWKLHASKMSGTDCWCIRVYASNHTCSRGLMHHDHRQASSSVIGELFKSKIATTGRKFKPKDLVEDVRRELGANMSYDKAWRAREFARACVHGTPEESYQKLPLWSTVLESCNPGSYTRIETDSEERFQFYFMAIGASIRGFQHMRPVVVVEGIFLKNRYASIMYIAACKDANEQIYPLAFGIGSTENYESCFWFFSRFKEAFGDRPDLVFVTYRHVSFAPAIQAVYPDAYHGYCTFHLRQNMREKFSKIETNKWKIICKCYDQAVEAYLIEDFDIYMAQIREINIECYNYLMEAHPSKWARSHFPSNRYNIMTSNAVEMMDSVLKDVKDHPLIPLLETIRCLLQKWFYERRNDADAHIEFPVSKEVNKKLMERKIASASFDVVPANMHEFEVHGGELIGKVNLRSRTCSCREFTLDGYPCVHALAVCKVQNICPYSLCDPYYSIDILRAGYSETVYPLGDPKQWHASADVMDRVVLPPICHRRVGRPKRNRVLSHDEEIIAKKCGRCKRTGHTRKTCTYPISDENTTTAASSH